MIKKHCDLTQILSPNSMKPTRKYLLCNVRQDSDWLVLSLSRSARPHNVSSEVIAMTQSCSSGQKEFFSLCLPELLSFFLTVTQSLRRSNITSMSPPLTLWLTMHRKGMNGDLGMWISSTLARLSRVPFPVMTQFLLLGSTTRLFHNFPT